MVSMSLTSVVVDDDVGWGEREREREIGGNA